MSRAEEHVSEQQIITIHTEYIQLDQLLKWANIIASGGEIKMLLQEEMITVNDEICQTKRKKIYPGDCVAIPEEKIKLLVAKEDKD